MVVISIKPDFFDLSFMGSGTLVDGVRRWFQRRTSSSSSSTSNSNFGSNSDSSDPNLNYPNPHKFDYVDNGGVSGDQLLSSYLRAQSSIAHKRKPLRKQTRLGEGGILEQLPEEEDDDLDYSALKLIKVPKRINHLRNPPPPLSALMDSHKKVFVCFLLLLLFL